MPVVAGTRPDSLILCEHEAVYTAGRRTSPDERLVEIIELRDHPGAQFEIQKYAQALAELAEPLFPATFRAWRELHSANHA